MFFSGLKVVAEVPWMMPSLCSVSIPSEAQLYLAPTSLNGLVGTGIGVDGTSDGAGVAVVPGACVGVGVGAGTDVGTGVGAGVGSDGPPLLLSVVTEIAGPSVLQFPAASTACTEKLYPVPGASPVTS